MAEPATPTEQVGAITKIPTTLSALEPGAHARVLAIRESGLVSRRLQEMGVVPGVTVRLIKAAPFGDPLEIRLLGYNLALRRSEADLVEVIA